MSEPDKQNITGIILSGGRGSRMGGVDKGLVELDGKPLIAHAIEHLKPQVGSIIISANRETERYAEYGYSVIRDTQDDYAGPLSGIASALFHARTQLAMIVPCDMPHLPSGLVARMYTKLDQGGAEVCMASDGEHLHPVVCLMKTALLEDLVRDVQSGECKTGHWMKQKTHVIEDFSDCPEAFVNINTIQELH
ncbi:MAG: molybdenum cofactor guanylyltransferase [Gammaproteobacteria bacterium]|nr:molybdenum cofactor guanylyltransferase [Gammaproteobacteria bacterium]MDH5592891.1 molybdenum cofactor guanylyltransferase [Gammaproteobacteria bacterium]MDH5614105.1 molybdenum cofactor guanylyltransferase [Gammaproteobacteria bacterium]